MDLSLLTKLRYTPRYLVAALINHRRVVPCSHVHSDAIGNVMCDLCLRRGLCGVGVGGGGIQLMLAIVLPVTYTARKADFLLVLLLPGHLFPRSNRKLSIYFLSGSLLTRYYVTVSPFHLPQTDTRSRRRRHRIENHQVAQDDIHT